MKRCSRCGQQNDEGAAFCAECRQPFEKVFNHAGYLATAHRIYGCISLFLVFGAMLGEIIFLIFFRYTLQRFLEDELKWLFDIEVSLTQMGPLIFGLMIIFITAMLGVIFTLPFFATARAIRRNRPWLKLTGVVAVLLSIMVFPFGTALSFYTLWYIFAGPGSRPAPEQYDR
ncbi:MAG: hypothetical protein AB1631_12610 [Acidobacteriota bacterium]